MLGRANQKMSDDPISFVFDIGVDSHALHEPFRLKKDFLRPLILDVATLDRDNDVGSRFVETRIDVALAVFS